MNRPQRRIAAVLGVAVPIVVHRQQLAANVLADEIVPAFIFVDVVAEVHYEVEVLLGHVLIGREETGLEMLARCDGEAKPIDLGVGLGKGARAAHRAQLVSGAELIPVPRVRLEARDFNVNGCPHSGDAVVFPDRTTRDRRSSFAICQCTQSPPPACHHPFSGSSARRVQRTAPS